MGAYNRNFTVYVMVQFHSWFKCYFPLFLDVVIMYDNELKTKENKI